MLLTTCKSIMEKYSLIYSMTNQRKAINELLEYKIFLIARNWMFLLPVTVIGMLLAFSNVESGQLLTSSKGIITLFYFSSLIIGITIVPWIKLFIDAKKCAKMPKKSFDVNVTFYEDYLAIQYPNEVRRLYYCDITKITHKCKLKYLRITSSLNSDLKPFYNSHALGGYSFEIPLANFKEDTVKELENFLKSKQKVIKYE